jgi:hypothetical protein
MTGRTILTLPDGMTVNRSASDLFITTNKSDGLVVDSFSIENNDQVIRIEHGNSVSASSEALRIRNLVVDTVPSIGTDATSFNIDTAAGSADVDVLNDISKASASIDSGSNVAVDADDESFGNLDIDTENTLAGQIGADTDIVIGLPDGNGVTFNSSNTDMTSGTVPSAVDGASATVDNKQITVPVTEDVGQGDDPQIQFDSISIDTTPDAQNTNMSVSVRAADSTGAIDLTAAQGGNEAIQVNTLELFAGADDTASVATSGAQQVFENDPNGENGVQSTTDKKALVVNSPSSAVPIERNGTATNVSISIPQSAGITFDQSSAPTDANTSNLDGSVNAVGYTDSRTLEVQFAPVKGISGESSDTDGIQLGGVQYNVSAGASGNVTLTATTNATNTEVSASNVITVEQVTVDAILGDNDGDAVTAGSDTASGLDLGSTTTVTLRLENSTGDADYDLNSANFGGGDIDLSVANAPGDASVTFNDSSPTTGEDGLAGVNVTIGDQIGTYNITAASASSPNQTFDILLEAQAGPVSQFNVTGAENALVDTSGLSATPPEDTGQAVYKVRIEDANGNLNTTDSGQVVQFSTSVGDNGATIETVVDTLNADGTSADDLQTDGEYDYTNDNGDGVFFVFVSDSTPGDTNLTVSQSGIEDTGTATFFDSVNSVDVSFNQTNIAVGDTVAATATPQTSDGTDIAVPRIGVTFNSTNQSIASSADGSFALSSDTDANGDAVTNVSIDANGTADITAQANGVEDSSTITVEEEQDQPDEVTSEVNFNDNAAADGATSLTVDNATHDADFVIVAHTATDSDGDGDIQFNNANGNNEIGTKIGSSAIQSNGTQSNIEVNLSKNVSDGDNIDSLAADDDQQIVMMLHVANESGDTNFGGSVKQADGETPVFDNNFVNVSSLDGAAGNADSDGDGEIDRTEVQTAITEFVVEETLTQEEAQDVIRAFIV